MAIHGSQYILWEYEEVIVYRDRKDVHTLM